MAEQKRYMDVPQGAVFGKPFQPLALRNNQSADPNSNSMPA